MAFIKRTLRKYFFRFMGTDIPRMIVGLQGGPQPKNPDYVLLAPNQVKALHSMQKSLKKWARTPYALRIWQVFSLPTTLMSL